MLGTSLINGFVSRAPIAYTQPWHWQDGRGFCDLFSTVQRKEWAFFMKGWWPIVSFSFLLRAKAYAHSLLIATFVGCSWSQSKCQGASVQTSLQPSVSLAG